MTGLIKYIIALLFVISFITNACAQGEKVVSFKSHPKDSIEDIIDNDNLSDKIRMDSLIINAQMDSVLTIITKSISEETIWKYFYVVISKTDKNIYVEILADFSNDQLFKNKGKIYKYDIYGSLDYNDRKIYVATLEINDEEMKHLFRKSEKSIQIGKTDIDKLLVDAKFENPMWLFEFKERSLVMVKSANVEYYNKINVTKRN